MMYYQLKYYMELHEKYGGYVLSVDILGRQTLIYGQFQSMAVLYVL